MSRSTSFGNGLGCLSVLWCGWVFAVGCGGSSGVDGQPCEGDACEPVPDGPCSVDGVSFESGTTGIAASDGCNTCSCQDGQLACTLIGCDVDTCSYEGREYSEGASFASADGCNTCTCSEGGVACTERACLPPPTCTYQGDSLAQGESRAAGDGCNTCTCQNGQMLCSARPCSAGCFGDAECGDGKYCAYPEGFCGGASSASFDAAPPEQGLAAPAPRGACQSQPEACTQDYSPVCGCNGVTYGNDCTAAGAGASIAYRGECQ